MSDIKFCECEVIGAVARDGKSTCAKCGGRDAYKKSPLRAESRASYTELKPCPLCGGEVELHENNLITCKDKHNCHLELRHPYAAATWDDARIQMIKRWNTRQDETK